MISQTGIFNAVRITSSIVVDTDYQLEFSESYSGTVHLETTIEGYQCCTSLWRSFESLIPESYANFILTVRCIAVATFCNSNMGFKIFDSYARDLYGRRQLQGTCVLLEVPHCIYTEWRHLDNFPMYMKIRNNCNY